MSEKDECFKKAIERYKDKYDGPDKVDMDAVEHQREWIHDELRGWEPKEIEGPIQQLWRSIQKTWDIYNGLRDPEPKRVNKPTQLRRPDITITTKDGSKVVIDNKFDGDDWQTKPGKNGRTQREDYNDINKQMKHRKDVKDLKLDKDVCKCDADPKPIEERVPVYKDPDEYYAPPPGVTRSGSVPKSTPNQLQRTPGKLPRTMRAPIPRMAPRVVAPRIFMPRFFIL